MSATSPLRAAVLDDDAPAIHQLASADDPLASFVILAIQRRRPEALGALLAIDPHVGGRTTPEQPSPLWVACMLGEATAVQALAEAQPDALSDGGAHGPPVCQAALGGRTAVIAAIATAWPHALHAADSEGNTPAILAASRGHLDALRLIADAAPATLGAANKVGITPIVAAWNGAHADAVQLLRERGFDDPAQVWGCGCEPGEVCGP